MPAATGGPPVIHALSLDSLFTPRLILHPLLCHEQATPICSKRRPSLRSLDSEHNAPGSPASSNIPTPPTSLNRRPAMHGSRNRALSQSSSSSSATAEAEKPKSLSRSSSRQLLSTPLNASMDRMLPPIPMNPLGEWFVDFLANQTHLVANAEPLWIPGLDAVWLVHPQESVATAPASTATSSSGATPPPSPPKKHHPSWFSFLSYSRRSSSASTLVSSTKTPPTTSISNINITASGTDMQASSYPEPSNPQLEQLEIQPLPRQARLFYVIELRKSKPQQLPRRSSTKHSRTSSKRTSMASSASFPSSAGESEFDSSPISKIPEKPETKERLPGTEAGSEGGDLIGIVELKPVPLSVDAAEVHASVEEAFARLSLTMPSGKVFGSHHRNGSSSSLAFQGSLNLSSTAPAPPSPLTTFVQQPGSSVSLPRHLTGGGRQRSVDENEDDVGEFKSSEEMEESTYRRSSHLEAAAIGADEEDGFPRFDVPHVTAIVYQQHMGQGYTTEAIKAVLLHLFRKDALSGKLAAPTAATAAPHFVFGSTGRWLVPSFRSLEGKMLPFDADLVSPPNKVAASFLEDWAHGDGEDYEDEEDDFELEEDDRDAQELDGFTEGNQRRSFAYRIEAFPAIAEDGDNDDDDMYPGGRPPNLPLAAVPVAYPKASVAGERVLERLGFVATGKVSCRVPQKTARAAFFENNATTTASDDGDIPPPPGDTVLVDSTVVTFGNGGGVGGSGSNNNSLGRGSAFSGGRKASGASTTTSMSGLAAMSMGGMDEIRDWDCFEIRKDQFLEVWVGGGEWDEDEEL
ncbi:hypothetical protein HDU97_006724 [Phlyctochytrium planicorne]|nr:hypothetical protein HDU97_006724 [Phlyctochytrium planicorne]